MRTHVWFCWVAVLASCLSVDALAARFLFDAAVGSKDADGDGMNNLAEYLAGTNPTNSTSALAITSVSATGDDLNITWSTAGGRTNSVEVAADLTSGYSNISPNIILPGTGDTATNYLDPGAATNSAMRHYRIRLVP
jgi:hypothetical protein